MAGPVALVGSGEFLEVMDPVDRDLLAGRPARVVFLPTAAAEEGAARVSYWVELGLRHYELLDVEAVPLLVLDRDDAERDELAAQVAGAGLIYLSGGNPGYLADTLRGTAVWRAIVEAWDAGAALAGCSAGACALTAVADRLRSNAAEPGQGLKVVPQISVIPHFDRIEAWAPGVVSRLLRRAPADTTVVGIDEETALVGGPEEFVVAGSQAVWLLGRDGTRARHGAGDTLRIPRNPHIPLPAGTVP